MGGVAPTPTVFNGSDSSEALSSTVVTYLLVPNCFLAISSWLAFIFGWPAHCCYVATFTTIVEFSVFKSTFDHATCIHICSMVALMKKRFLSSFLSPWRISRSFQWIPSRLRVLWPLPRWGLLLWAVSFLHCVGHKQDGRGVPGRENHQISNALSIVDIRWCGW